MFLRGHDYATVMHAAERGSLEKIDDRIVGNAKNLLPGFIRKLISGRRELVEEDSEAPSRVAYREEVQPWRN
jgi:hypothetical protein